MDKKITSMEGEADEGLDAGCTKKREAETAVGLFEGAAQSLGHEATRPAKARKTMQRQTQPDDPAPRHADTCSVRRLFLEPQNLLLSTDLDLCAAMTDFQSECAYTPHSTNFLVARLAS